MHYTMCRALSNILKINRNALTNSRKSIFVTQTSLATEIREQTFIFRTDKQEEHVPKSIFETEPWIRSPSSSSCHICYIRLDNIFGSLLAVQLISSWFIYPSSNSQSVRVLLSFSDFSHHDFTTVLYCVNNIKSLTRLH